MRIASFLLHIAPFIALIGISSTSVAQNYPTKPIRIVAAAAGGTTDVTARILVSGLTPALGQSVIIENRDGLGIIPGDVVSKAPPDGYTLLIHTGNMWISAMLSERKVYDPISSFSPISLLVRAPNVLVVNPSSPANSARELIELAKKSPGQLNYATGPVGSASHLSGTLFKMMAQLEIQHVPYKGSQQGLNDLMAGRVQLMFPSAASVTPLVKAGKLKALAVTSATPSSLAPGLPTVAASGLPGFEMVGVVGMWAPAGTSDAIIRRINQESARFLSTPDTRAKYFGAGLETIASTPEQLTQSMKTEMTSIDRLIKETGLREAN